MQKAGFDRIDRLVLTGAFGARFNWQNAVAIGMLPGISSRVDVRIVENAAGRGAIISLLNRTSRKEKDQLARQATVLELSADPDFVTEFVMATAFPDL